MLSRCLSLAALLACSAGPAWSDLRLEAVTGFDNHFRAGAWTPIQVRISGASADTSAQIQVIVRSRGSAQSYGKTVRLRGGGQNGPYTLYYFHSDGAQPRDITIQVTADGRTLAEKTLDQLGNPVQVFEGQPAILCLSQDQSGLNPLAQVDLNFTHSRQSFDPSQGLSGYPSGSTRTAYNRILYPRAADLPDSPTGYQSIDAVVLGELPLDLINEDQWDALTGWVKTGGLLVVSGSPDLNRLKTNKLAEILPIEPTGVRQISTLSSLAYRYQTAPKLRNASIVAGRVRSDSQALCVQGDTPLVVERRIGNGLVVFTAFDLLSPEFKAWPGQAGMWREIMLRNGAVASVTERVRLATEPSPYRGYGYGYGYGANSNRMLADALAGVQSTEAPSFRSIGIFLLLYIVMLVPGNYLLLKRLDRKELAWLTIPAIIAVFSIGAYTLGYRIKGGQLYLHYCSVLEGAANSDGWDAYSVGSIFSPRQARYDLTVNDPAALVSEVTEGGMGQRAAGDLAVERDQKTTVKNALVNMWDNRQFDFQSYVSLGGQVSAAVTKTGANSATVELTNATKMKLSDCSVSYGGTPVLVGDLPPSGSKTVRVTLTTAGQPGSISIIGGGPSLQKSAKDIRDSLVSVATSAPVPQVTGSYQAPQTPASTPFVLTGWFDEPAVSMTLENEEPQVSGVNLLVVHLPNPDVTRAAPPVAGPPPAARIDPFAGQGFPGGRSPLSAPPMPSFPGTASIPAQAAGHNQRAYDFANSGNLDKALAEAQAALKAAPDNGMVLDTVGEMHQRRREFAMAVSHYRQALKRLPPGSRTETEQKYGETLVEMGQKDEGIKHLRIAAADFSSPRGAIARQILVRLGVSATGSAPVTGTGPLTNIPQGQSVPQIPTYGKGRRRFLQHIQSGSYYIVQEWDYTAGQSRASTSTTFIQPGQPLPK
jgi:hypothetical protein